MTVQQTTSTPPRAARPMSVPLKAYRDILRITGPVGIAAGVGQP